MRVILKMIYTFDYEIYVEEMFLNVLCKEKLPPKREWGGLLAGKGNAVFLGDGTNLLNGQIIILSDVFQYL